jgi:recombination protein RecT
MSGQIVPFKERVNTFRGALDALKPQLAAALPKHMTADRMMRIVMTTVQRTPAILECSNVSVFGCILQAAQLGLEPDGILGQAYLIPYGKTCTLIPGYKGLIKLARNSGELATIYAKIVHANDAFKYAYGLADVLEHVPCLDEDPGDATHAYAVARLKDGSVQFDVMSVVEIEKIRQRSRAGNNGPWVTDWEEMAKKTVLRRLCKMLPASVELSRAVALDEAVDANLPQQFETPLDVSETPAEKAQNGASGGPPKTLDDLAATAKPAASKTRGVSVKLANGTPVDLSDEDAAARAAAAPTEAEIAANGPPPPREPTEDECH